MLILTPAAFTLTPAQTPGVLVDWVRSVDGRVVLEHGTCAPALLPRDDDCVWVLPPTAVSWHRVKLPKLAPSRVRAALEGLLEEQLLSDPLELHLALAPGSQPGQDVWVAATRKTWLQNWLQTLEAAQRPVSRIVPAQWPEGQAIHWIHQQQDQPWVLSTGAAGVSCLPLDGFAHAQANVNPGSRLDTDASAATGAVYLAEPSLVAQAEKALDQRFGLCTRSDWLLRCAQAEGNLAQFDLSLSGSVRRGQRLRRWLREGRSAPQWRPARWGLGALLVVQLLGLNAWAWQERQTLKGKEDMLGAILKSRFPEISLVLDAPVQMQRELDRLRIASGALSMGDLEAQLAALTLATQGAVVPISSIEYSREGTRLTLSEDVGERWPAWQAALARTGLQATLNDNVLSLRVAPSLAPPS